MKPLWFRIVCRIQRKILCRLTVRAVRIDGGKLGVYEGESTSNNVELLSDGMNMEGDGVVKNHSIYGAKARFVLNFAILTLNYKNNLFHYKKKL